jgi:TPR repeat protein
MNSQLESSSYTYSSEQGEKVVRRHDSVDALFALYLLYGIGLPKDVKRAFEVASAGAMLGCADCDVILCDCYIHNGEFTEKHLQIAKDSAAMGSYFGQFVLGKCFSEGCYVEIDNEKAARLYHQAAEQDHAEAQYKLARMYGFELAQNHAEAKRLYQLAFSQGHSKAQFRLGHMFFRGNGVPKDEAEAIRHYYLAVESGNPDAQVKLGRMLDKGNYIVKDKTEAIRLYKLAAEQGHAGAHYKLGRIYQKGKSVSKCLAEAERLYHIAAEQNHAKALLKLSLMYETGEGVAIDKAKAKEYFALALSNGLLDL